RGLHPHRSSEGFAPVDDRTQARAAQRDAADCHARRALAGLHRRRGDSDRDGVLLAGRGPGRLRRRSESRLSHAAGSVPLPDDLGRLLQPPRRPALFQARPEDHVMGVILHEPGAVAEPAPIRSRRGILWDTIRRRPSAAVGAVVLSLIVLAAVLAPWIAPYGLHDQVGPVFGRPSRSHPLGLDDGGIDVVTLLM